MNRNLEDVIRTVILPIARKTILLHNGKATYDQLLRNIVLALMEKGLLHERDITRLNYEEIFDRYLERVGNRKEWRLRRREEASLIECIPITKRIEWLILSVMRNKGGKASPDDIFSAVFTNLRGFYTPENEEILDVLGRLARPIREKIDEREEVFWVLREAATQRSLEEFEEISVEESTEEEAVLDHDRVIVLLSEIGASLNYDIWVGQQEQNRNPELRQFTSIEVLKIPSLDEVVLERISQVDVIWLIRDRYIPVMLFEVEHTTNIRQGILRLSNIFEVMPHLRIDPVIVIPDNKLDLFYRVVEEPSIRRVLREFTLFYITYAELLKKHYEVERGYVSSIDYIRQQLYAVPLT